MSFDSKNFSVMAYANGFTLWNYTTADTLEALRRPVILTKLRLLPELAI